MKRFLTLFLMILLVTISAFALASCDEQEHVHTEQTLEAVAPTCTGKGLTEGKKCSACGEILVAQENIPAKGHSYGEFVTTKEPSCTEEGAKEKSCSCGDKITEKIEPTGHTYKNSYVCTVCQDELVPSNDLLYKLNTETNTYTVTGISNILYVSNNVKIKDGAIDLTTITMLQSALSACGCTIEYNDIYHSSSVESAPTSGYALYIYEGVVPPTIPTDGSVWFLNVPKEDADKLGFKISLEKDATAENITNGYEIVKSSFVAGDGVAVNKITKNVEFKTIESEQITINPATSRYGVAGYIQEFENSQNGLTEIDVSISMPKGFESVYDAVFYKFTNAEYKEISTPVMMVGDLNETTKSIITTFDFQDSSLPFFITDFVLLVNNMVEYSKPEKEIIIPYTYKGLPVTSIGSRLFSGCINLTSVTIPNSVTSIGNNAFWNCTSLTSVTIGDSVTSIGSNAFHGCTSLTSIVIPSSVTSIDSYAFEDCTALTIYCVAESQPSAWSASWNNSGCPVYWYSEAEPGTSGNYWYVNKEGNITLW